MSVLGISNGEDLPAKVPAAKLSPELVGIKAHGKQSPRAELEQLASGTRTRAWKPPDEHKTAQLRCDWDAGGAGYQRAENQIVGRSDAARESVGWRFGEVRFRRICLYCVSLRALPFSPILPWQHERDVPVGGPLICMCSTRKIRSPFGADCIQTTRTRVNHARSERSLGLPFPRHSQNTVGDVPCFPALRHCCLPSIRLRAHATSGRSVNEYGCDADV